MKINILFFVIVPTLAVFVQNHNIEYLESVTDSLVLSLKPGTHDTLKIQAYLDAGYNCEVYDINKSLEYYNKAVSLSEKNLKNFLSGTLYKNKYLKKSLTHHYLLLYEKSLRYRGIIYDAMGKYPLALENYQGSLKISEYLGEKLEMAKCFSNISLVLTAQGNYKHALDYLTKSLQINEELGDSSGLSNSFTQMGNICLIRHDFTKALEYYQKSLFINEKIRNRTETAVCLGNIGIVYKKMKDIGKALEYYRRSLEVDEELNDLSSISETYNNIAALYAETREYGTALSYAEKSIKISMKLGIKENLRFAYGVTSECYAKTGNFKQAYYYYNLLAEIKDSIYNEQSSRMLHEMEVKYQTEKKQQEIEILNKDKALQKTEIARKEAEVKQQETLKYAFISGFVLMLSLSVVIFKSYRQKRKANILLSRQNEEIKQQKEEITAQRDEIESQRNEIMLQRDIVIKQKEHIEEIHKEVTDSICYARQIQDAVVRVNHSTKSGLGEHFILFMPKDVVSGDFYWANFVNEWLIIAVADCTGHGIPGAFMSMLGISFLNEIVRKKELTKASEVLDHLRESVIEALQQKGSSDEQKDGMDIAFCAINMKTLEMNFAGANNPCYIIQFGNEKNKQIAGGGQFPNFQINKFPNLFEIKGDKMPIGIHDRMAPFTNHVFQLRKGDIIYLMSDGFEDQFGGPHRKKFLAKNLRNLLLANCQLPMADQKQILETTITEWIGEGEQIDDITIIGIKI